MVFQFELMDIDSLQSDDSGREVSKHDPLVWKEWKLNEMKTIVGKWQSCKRDEGFWNTCVCLHIFSGLGIAGYSPHYINCSVFIENHDNARSVSRFGNDSLKWRTISAKLLCILQITQSGTLYVYQGEEIGMKNFPRSWGIEEYKDVATINYWKL